MTCHLLTPKAEKGDSSFYVPSIPVSVWQFLTMSGDDGVEALAAMFWMGAVDWAPGYERSAIAKCSLNMSLFRFVLGSAAGVRGYPC